MKKIISIICIIFFSTSSFSQEEKNILGYWLNEEKDAKIQIFEEKNILVGKIVWLKEPKDEFNKWKLDKENPNEKLRNRKILGLQIINNLNWDSNKREWRGGEIYDAREGDTYSLYAKIKENGDLSLRGYIGFSLFGKTTTWTKTKLY